MSENVADGLAELMTIAGLARLLGVSERTAANVVKESWAPPAIQLTPRCVRYSKSEWLKALAKAPRRRDTVEPPQLRAGKAAAAVRHAESAGVAA